MKIIIKEEVKYTFPDLKTDIEFRLDRERSTIKSEDMVIEPGFCYFVNADNGYGKSTFFNILMMLKNDMKKRINIELTDKEGNIIADYRTLKPLSAMKYREKYFSKVFQHPKLIESLTIEENFRIFKSDTITDGEILFEKDEDDIKYSDVSGKYPNMFSGGEIVMIYYAIMLDFKKPFIFIDELYNHLDGGKRKFLGERIITKMKENKGTNALVVNEHTLKDKLKEGSYSKEMYKLDVTIKKEKDENYFLNIYRMKIEEAKNLIGV